jgi:hypothetical protein
MAFRTNRARRPAATFAPLCDRYQHNQRLGFHADPTDIVALLCIRPAKSGGLSSIVSGVAVHNEIVRSRPDLAQVLYVILHSRTSYEDYPEPPRRRDLIRLWLSRPTG